MSRFKSVLAQALASLVLAVTAFAPAARAADLYVPTYGYAAQHYGTPRDCCGAVPCCVRQAPPPGYGPSYGPSYGYDERRFVPPCRDPRACRSCGCGGEVRLGPAFAYDGGVGPIPEGGYGGGGYVIMGGGGSAGAGSGAWSNARAQASAFASSHVSVRIGGGHASGCGCR